MKNVLLDQKSKYIAAIFFTETLPSTEGKDGAICKVILYRCGWISDVSVIKGVNSCWFRRMESHQPLGILSFCPETLAFPARSPSLNQRLTRGQQEAHQRPGSFLASTGVIMEGCQVPLSRRWPDTVRPSALSRNSKFAFRSQQMCHYSLRHSVSQVRKNWYLRRKKFLRQKASPLPGVYNEYVEKVHRGRSNSRQRKGATYRKALQTMVYESATPPNPKL